MAYDEDYYKKLKEQDYVALQNSEIQLENARQRAMKNMQTNLDSLGMGSSGFGSTARAGVEGQYMQGLQAAQDRYNANIQNINEQQTQAEQQSVENYLSQLNLYQGDNEAVYNKLAADGYGSYDSEGKWVWNDEKFAGMNPGNADMFKQGIAGLDYSNNTFNQGLVGKYVSSSIANLADNAESEEAFASGIYQTLIASGVLTVNEDGSRELHLDRLDPTTRMMVQQYENQFHFTDSNNKFDNVSTTISGDWFTQAANMANKNSVEYYAAITQGYNDIINGLYKLSNTGAHIQNNESLTVKFDGKKYSLKMNGIADENVRVQLNKIWGNGAGEGHLAYYNGKLYIKGKNGWLNIESGSVISGKNYQNLLESIKSYTQAYLGYDPEAK